MMSDTTNVKSSQEKYKCKISDFDVIKFLLDVLDEEHLGLKEEIIKTLKNEYERDVAKGIDDVEKPKNYFPDDDPSKEPIVRWRSHASLLFSNWLNYCVYQETPYDLDQESV